MTPEMKAYVALLQIPHTSPARIHLQSALAYLRDYIAKMFSPTDDAETIQNIFKAIARERDQ